MSKCISSHGEYSSHENDEFHVCKWCGMFDEAVVLKKLEAAEAERDTAVAAIERVRLVIGNHRSIEQHNEMVPVSDMADLIREPSSADYLAALDGAPEPEWEYGLLVEALGDTKPEPYPTRESAQHVIDHPEIYRKWTHDNPVTMRRRRPAGPWLPVEGESKS